MEDPLTGKVTAGDDGVCASSVLQVGEQDVIDLHSNGAEGDIGGNAGDVPSRSAREEEEESARDLAATYSESPSIQVHELVSCPKHSCQLVPERSAERGLSLCDAVGRVRGRTSRRRAAADRASGLPLLLLSKPCKLGHLCNIDLRDLRCMNLLRQVFVASTVTATLLHSLYQRSKVCLCHVDKDSQTVAATGIGDKCSF